MLKLQDRRTTKEMPARLPEAPEQPSELPEGVTIPDDLRGIEFAPPTTRAATAVRWLRWIPLVAVLAIGGVIAFALLRDGGTTDQVDQTAPALNPATAQVPTGSPFDAPLAPALNPDTAQVPTGSPFDAPLAPALDPDTAQVPSGSPFDAPLPSTES